VDFSKARLHDIRWWRRVNRIIEAMARDDELAILRAAFDYQRTLVGLPNIADNDFKNSQKLANELLADIQNNVKPWAAKSGTERREAQMTALIDMYKRKVGDPSDPVFQDKLRQDLERQRQQRLKPVAETELQRIDRLVRERDERVRQQRRKT
jgi:hypothetical protein